ncbi:ABC transporter substrate-binding protein [Brevibacterium album]|uniref:ABC transporter substrate-binding protein n=1 Tax=Brevibacterium album TaxID=417948 RepID=UPI000420DC7E|nr:ABC transporter substrate-binding protein [Brevibacterium album]
MKRKTLAAAALAGALTLTACSTSTTGDTGEGGGAGALTVGTTDKVTKIDPAGAYDNGSFFVMTQVFPFLMSYTPGTADVEPSIAESAEYTSDTTYEVTLKEGLTFANGNPLTSSDVKFSFDRQKAIADPNGPASLLGSLDSVETPDETTVVFHLNRPTDQTFPQVLAGPAGPIVDEDVFAADALTDDTDIVEADAFAGPFRIDSYDFNNLISYQAFEGYQGSLGQAASDTVNMTYYSDANNMKLAVEQGEIDVAYRSLSATDIEDLEGNDAVEVHHGPGGEIRYIVFNFDTMPYGAATDEADEEKALAVRQAVAGIVDRQALADQVYKGTFTPLLSHVPEGLDGANQAVGEEYLTAEGGPDVEAAAQRLEDAEVETPVELKLQYSPDHYGPSSGDEYALVKQQLEDTGLFTVDLQSTEWVQYSEDRVADVYPAYQLGWFPDYSDADNYLVPFFYDTDDSASFLGNHFRDEELNEKLAAQVSVEDPAERAALIEEIQNDLAQSLPTVPLLQGEQIAVTGTDVQGVDETLDPSFQFRLALLSK